MQANAISDPQPAGGWGKGSHVTRSHLQLLKKAIREGWDIPEDVKPAIVESLKECMNSGKNRLAIRAAEVVIELDRQGLLPDDD